MDYAMDAIELTDAEFEKLSRMIKDTLGVNLGNHKKELLKNRLRKRVKALGLKNFGEYYKYLVESDAEGEELVNMSSAITTNVTSFFRENDHFVFLKTKLLPRLAERKKAAGNKRIRCWSAGCSSGQEAYSMAITLRDFFKDDASWDVKILATDISQRVVETAREGVYKRESVEKLDAATLRENFLCGFGRLEGKVAVKKNLKDMVTVQVLNFMDEKFPFKGPFDFIFCRNVLIYFDRKTQTELLNKFHAMLDSGGHLFLGHSEGLAGGHKGFKYAAPAVYVKAQI